MEEKKVTWLELFFDLVFVTAVSYTTHLFIEIDHHEDQIFFYLLEYLLMVFPMFWLWIGQTMFFNRFGEYLRRPELFMLPQMFFFILMTASLDFEFSSTYHSFLAGYLGLKVLTVWQYHLVSKSLSDVQKKATTLLCKILSVGVIIPAVSVFFASEWHFIIMYIGIFIDMLLPLFFNKELSKVPVNLPHLTERFGLFVLITFGESLVSVTNILKDSTTDLPTLTYAIISFVLICTLWAGYFFPFEKALDRHSETNGQIILYGHFFVLLAVMLLAGTIELLHVDSLPHKILLGFLYGSIAMFYVSTQTIFYLHRKKEANYVRQENFITLAIFLLLYIANLFITVAPIVNLAIVACICLAHFFTQARALALLPADE